MFSEPVIALSQKKCKHITDSYYQKQYEGNCISSSSIGAVRLINSIIQTRGGSCDVSLFDTAYC